MLSPKGQIEFDEVVEGSVKEREKVRRLVNTGRWREAEKDPDRLKNFNQKQIDKVPPKGAESFTGDTIDLQSASFLTEGAHARCAIAYVEVNTPQSQEVGSGFMVSPRLFLTCQHVIKDADTARGTLITFDRELDEFGKHRPTTSYLLDPDTFALFSPDSELDYALVAVGNRNGGEIELDRFGCCILMNSPDRHVIGMKVNIIQHPRGWPKMIAIRNNLLTHRSSRTLLYETDTEQGSSGAPVFNDDWELVALHHWGEPYLQRFDEASNQVVVNVNEGVRISSIFDDLTGRLGSLTSSQRELLKEALTMGDRIKTDGKVKSLSPPRPQSSGSESGMVLPSRRGAAEFAIEDATKGVTTMQNQESTELKITIPVELTIRIGALGRGVSLSDDTRAVAPKELTRGAEALKIDKDYDNRGGYDRGFIAGFDLPLPQPNATLKKQVAPLRATEPNPDEGELKYEHFTLKLHKSKRIAMFTATNIDGEKYLEVNRKTGKVSGSEGETWYKDPRISESFFIDQSFYSAWSTYFDRGHLTRRTDPTWGDPAEAERANADTYHFTNCSPQHFRFNQTTDYWQGAERYILENGVLAADSGKHLCVFQGPLFDDTIDLWADDVQIPSSFFKVVVWKGVTGLKSVGLIVDQLQLLSEPRKNFGQPKDLAAVNVNQWRVSIAQIEKRSKLDFGPDVLNADTSKQAGQPNVGAEAGKLIGSLADILA
jgi:endonuclease G, mitochondrial